MTDPSPFRAFLKELRRRRVYRVGVLYLTGGWVCLEVADLVLPALGAPDSLLPLLILLAGAGFPVALLLAWAYEVTPETVAPEEGRTLTELLGSSRGPRLALAAGVAALTLALLGMGWVLWVRPAAEGLAGEAASPSSTPSLDPARVAVLYLDDHSPDGSLEYLANGLTEGLIHELSQVEALEVVSRNGVKPFRSRAVPTDTLTAALEAGSIVEGSVSGSRDSIRVTVQLVDGESDAHVESLTFLRSRDHLFSLQTDLAREVAAALRRRLGREIQLRSTRSETDVPDAWATVFRARTLLDDYEEVRRGDAGAARRLLERADSLLARAGELDPEWAAPWTERALVAHRRSLLEGLRAGSVAPEWARRGVEHARHALQRDPEAATARHALGKLLHALADALGSEGALERREAGHHLQAAVDRDAGHAAGWIDLSEWLLEEGRFTEAQRAAREARDADAFLELPHDVLHQSYYATVQEGPVEEARAICDEGRARFPRSSAFLTCQLFVLGSFPQVHPDLPRAWRLRDSLVTVSSAGRAEDMGRYGSVLVAKVAVRAARPDSARRVLLRALGTGEPPAAFTYDAAHFWVLMNEPETAVELLRQYLAAYPDTTFLVQDWWFDDLHGHRAFRELVGLDP